MREKIVKAIDLYRRFSGDDPQYIDRVDHPVHPVVMEVGKLEGVMYETTRDGVREKYFHRFAKNARPLLVASFDGSQLYIVGGQYDFTEDGIVDK